ncbi:hypothetical protein [Microlunatus soli]|uniref:Uncharacterized protein n=1 Tax=Microlunatus soli TaxID=630515 RepID=A0A1H1YWV6_9ACTN|nr:hypothetical protein [Microlunatus soli]SDT25842.1 hypothetical protein SAMN04489812_4828 [Microlunatus soli]
MIMGILGPRKGLDRAVHRSWLDATRDADLSAGSLLAWANSTDGRFVIGSVGVLSVSSGDPDRLVWRHIGWHQIERGGFDADTTTLRWTLYADQDGQGGPDRHDGLDGAVALQHPGRLPMVFRDRVNTSIAVEQFIGLGDDEPAPGRQHRTPGVIVSGRRDLGRRNAPIHWHVSVPRGISWDSPGIRELAAESLLRMRAEYDPNG